MQRAHPDLCSGHFGHGARSDYNSMDAGPTAMRGTETEGSERPRASHARPLSTGYCGNPSHRSICPCTRVPVARSLLVSYVC
eukprot:3943891-Prymnesium_polylepis.1